MIKRMEDIQKRLALKFRVNKIENSGVHGPILLNELFHNKDKNSSTKLVEGFLKINTEEPEVCWHLWVEDENEIVYDIKSGIQVSLSFFNPLCFDFHRELASGRDSPLYSVSN